MLHLCTKEIFWKAIMNEKTVSTFSNAGRVVVTNDKPMYYTRICSKCIADFFSRFIYICVYVFIIHQLYVLFDWKYHYYLKKQ